jgi:hypothetical protein
LNVTVPDAALPYVELARLYDSDPHAHAWINVPLGILASAGGNKDMRQKVLLYGTVIHGMIGTLDPNHESTKNRRSFANKLSLNSKRDLKFRVFSVYVRGVANAKKYFGEAAGTK